MAQADSQYTLPPNFRSDAAQLPGGLSQSGSGEQRAYTYGGHGDNPVDHPGMSRATPTTIEVVRPERTIIPPNVDEALPVIISSIALALVLSLTVVALVRGRAVSPRTSRNS